MTDLVGRQHERQLLRAVLEDRAPRLLMVRGPSGVGKTALVEQALQDFAPAGPILGRAKYAEQATTAGLRPVVDALSEAVDSALGRLYDPAGGAASLRGLLGAQADALVAAGFGAASLAGCVAPSASGAPGREGAARLVDALVRVLQWLDGFALPVVLFIDDWHRAPNEAVGFVQACSRRSDSSTLKLVLAARGAGAMALPEHAMVVLLEPLSPPYQRELLERLLGDPVRAQSVLDWLGDQANGLPFDLTEIALALGREQAFVGEGATQRVDTARAAAIDHRDINQVIVRRARALPASVLRLGAAAALWGDRARLETLGRCLGETEAATTAAAKALESHGLLRLEADEVALPHDRTRESLLQVPGDAALRALAREMADILLGDLSAEHRQVALRLKLVCGLDDVRDAGLARLFASEGTIARQAAQFDLAAEFGEAAWSIAQRLGGMADGDRLAVLREACFAAAHRRQTETTRERCALMVAAASDTAELAEAYECSVIAMHLAGTAADAWGVCRDGLARFFGIRLPERLTTAQLLLAILAWRLLGRKPRPLVRRDARTERAVTSFGNSAGYAIWERSPRYAAYFAIRSATRARLMGYDSAFWQSVDAFINSAMKNYRAAAAAGDRALAGLPQLTVGRGMTMHRAVVLGQAWRDPRASLIDNFRSIYDYCIADNDLVGAANAVLNDALWTWRSAATLDEVAAKLEETHARADRLGNAGVRDEIGRLILLVQRLREPEPISSRPPDELSGRPNDIPVSVIEYLAVAEDWPAILRIASEVRPSRRTLDYNLVGVSWRFYQNLASLKMGLPVNRKDLRFVERIAAANPTDHLGKVLLLRAEGAYRRGRRDCLRAYSQALEAMQKGSSRLEAGVAAECAAVAARGLRDNAAHEQFRTAAAAIWSGWGAFAKLASYETESLDEPIRARLAEAEAQAALARRGEQAKSRFLAEVGHELRTPLQAMQGLLDLAAERPEELNLGEIRDVFGSLKAVVDDLTELGALGAEAPLNLKATDLAALIGSELGLMDQSARQKGLTLDAELEALQAQSFAVDADRVRQVVRNLVSNAVKYTETGGVRLCASVSEQPDGPAQIALTVEDSGPGIPEERLSHLFEPFDRAGRADSNGLGLGLALSRRIADRMAGTLTAENRREGGSRFVFSFAAERRDAPTRSAASTRPLSILIVEDAAPIRRLMARLLTLDGHAVSEAETLAQGLDRARRQRLDLMLLDLNLPDGDGQSLLEQWPSERPRPPVIVLTAAAGRGIEERVASARATMLRKPIAAAELRSAIAQACGASEPAKPANGFDAEMARLVDDAREEIAKRSVELADLVRQDCSRGQIQQQAHKLAGLAAQFDAPRLAEAADLIEQACNTGAPPRDGLAALERAMALDWTRAR